MFEGVKCERVGVLKSTGVHFGIQTHFDIKDVVGIGQVDVTNIVSKEKPNAVPEGLIIDDDNYKYNIVNLPLQYWTSTNLSLNDICEFIPQIQDPLQIKVNLVSFCNLKKLQDVGSGLQSDNVRNIDNASFNFITEDAGAGHTEIEVIRLIEVIKPERVNLRKAADGLTYECDNKPLKNGNYLVFVGFGGLEIYQGPFEIKETEVVAYELELKSGVINYKFSIFKNMVKQKALDSIECPSQSEIDIKDNFSYC